MTNNLASIQLVYGGSDLNRSDLSLHLELVVGLHDSPEVRGTDVVVPYNPGRVARPRRFDRRRIVLEGFARGVAEGTDDEARAAYRELRAELAALFDAEAEPATLQASLEDGSVLEIEARTLSLVGVERVQSLYADVSVELEAVSDWEAAAS